MSSTERPAALAAPSAVSANGAPSIAPAQSPLPPDACATQGPVATAYSTGVNCRTLDLDGHQRRFVVYVPAIAPVTGPRAPVVIMFHGASGDGEQFLRISGWREQSDATGAISVFPTGERYRVLETGRLTTHWNSFGIEEEIDVIETPLADDVGFMDEIISDLQAGLTIDRRRVYASGFSNGASFAARLAVERSDKLAAAAFSAGGLTSPQSPARPVPTYVTVGTFDDRILAQTNPPLTELPLDPAEVLTNSTLGGFFDIALGTLGLDENLQGIVAESHSTTLRWPATGAGPDGALFKFAILEGLTHQYPQADNNAAGFAAAAEFWEFFQAHRLP